MTTKRKQGKSIKKPQKPLPIVVVPDKSYLDDTGNVIPIDVICIADPKLYEQMKIGLKNWAKFVPHQKGIVKG